MRMMGFLAFKGEVMTRVKIVREEILETVKIGHSNHSERELLAKRVAAFLNAEAVEEVQKVETDMKKSRQDLETEVVEERKEVEQAMQADQRTFFRPIISPHWLELMAKSVVNIDYGYYAY